MIIKFVCGWEKNKEKTWSGIPNSIKNAFESKYTVRELNTNTFWFRLFRKLRFFKFDMGAIYMLLQRRFNVKYKPKEDEIVFQFDDWIDVPNSYKYCDLSLSYLIDLYYSNFELFKKSNFRNANIKVLKRKRLLEKKYFEKNLTCVFTMSNWLAQYLITKQGLPASKVMAVGGGISIDKEKIDYSKKENKRILFIGRDFERKGGDIVVKAFKRLRLKHPEIELYILGPNKNPVSQACDGIVFIGDVSYSELPNYYNLCDIFVMPSYFEPLGLVFAEALSFGLPCIGRNVCEMPFLIENGVTGFIIDNDDEIVLADYMYELLTNSLYKNNVRNRKDFYLTEYSWNTVCDKMLSVMKRNSNQ